MAELLEHVPTACASSLSYAGQSSFLCHIVSYVLIIDRGVLVSLEDERREGFTEATMRQSHQMRMPVTLEVGVTHIRITSVGEIRHHC